MSDQSDILQQRVAGRIEAKQPIQICAGNSKRFYAQAIHGEDLDVSLHNGIISYEPTELVLTARCGTPLLEIENALAEHNQMLAFEPPMFTPHSTFGGALAAGLSGPRRPFSGAIRDFTLGMALLNGRAEILRFGGQVMKNVAGYDLSRLLVGSMGTLGIILDASVKVLPKPETEASIVFELDAQDALDKINDLCNRNTSVTASCYDGTQLYVRLSGNTTTINSVMRTLGGERLDDDGFWLQLRNQQHEFFSHTQRIWRLSLPAATPHLSELSGQQLIEWRGAQRWLCSDEPAQHIRALVTAHNGHATLFRNATLDDQVFQPLDGKLRELHLGVKLAMDPNCLFNPGRMYEDF